MDGFLGEWLNLLLRWGHMIAGIAWIGTSFYFVALDFSLKKPAGLPAGVAGEAWEVHGGGFYHVQKYLSAPARLPTHLVWFKWEAYLTWVTGFLLLVVQYYFQASAYLIDPAVMALAPWQAIAISLLSIIAGWAIYDALCRSALGRNTWFWQPASSRWSWLRPLFTPMSFPDAGPSYRPAWWWAPSWPPMSSW